MAVGLDIVTNDAGDLIRSAHARDMGEDVIVSLQRLVRLTRLHDTDNQAFARQLEQTHKLVVEYCLHAGTHLSVMFAHKVVLIGGQILKGSRGGYDAAQDLGEILAWCGGAELIVSRDITIKDLTAFADAISGAQRNRRNEEFQSPTPKIRLRQVSEAAKLRGVDVEHLDLEQRIVRTYASAVVVMRRFFEDLKAGRLIMPPKIKRIAQSLVDLSGGNTPSYLGVTEVRNQNHDDAGRAVNTAILAVATARQVTADRTILSQIAMAALMHDVARPRALAKLTGGVGGMTARLSEDAEDRLAPGAAAVLTALGRVNEPTIARTVVTYEALWIRRTFIGPVYGGRREPTVHARIIAISRRYNDLVTPDPGLPPPPPDKAIAQLSKDLTDPADRTVLRMLVAALGLFPVGTLVVLSTGETAEVVLGHTPSAPGQPRVRLIMDARGGMITPPRELDLAAPPPNLGPVSIQRVLSTDGWAKAAELDFDAPQGEPVVSSAMNPLAAAAAEAPFVSVEDELIPVEDSAYPPESSHVLEDSIPSAVSNSLTRSLGWHDPPPPQPQPPQPPPSSRRQDPMRATMPAAPMARKFVEPPPEEPELEFDVQAAQREDQEERTLFQPSPFEVVEDAAPPDDDDDEAGTMFYQSGAAAPAIVGPRLREQAGIPPTAQGDLGRTPLVHVLVYVLDRELSGSLVLMDPDEREHCVYFDRGAPAKIRTEHPVALLGEEFIAARVLPPAALDAMIKAASEHNSLLGEYLVRNRLITAAALENALRAQVIHRLEWLAKLPGDSLYEFYRDQNLLASWGGDPTPCEPLSSILAAMRSWNDHERIISNLMRLKENPVRLHPEADLQGLQLTPEEDGVLATIQAKPITLLELYGNSLSVDRGISAFLYMLFATRQLQVPGQDRGPMRSTMQGRPVVPLPESQRPSPNSTRLESTLRNAAPVSHPEPQPPLDDDDELSYESYPSLPTSPSAVAQAVISDMRTATAISFKSESPEPPEAEPYSRDSCPGAPPSALRAISTEGLEATAKGKLASTPLIHVLTYMLDHQATGSVVLTEPDSVQHIAYFENGAAAKVRTGRAMALLGEILVASGELAYEQLDDAVMTALEIDALLGEYLMLENLANRSAVIHALEQQVVEKLVELVNLPDDTRYAFYRGVNLLSTWAGDDLFPARPLSVILAASRAWRDRRRIRGALLKILDQELRLHPKADLSGLATSPAEVAVLNALLSGGHTLRTLHKLGVAREEEVNSLVYTLAITRQFHFRRQKKDPMRFIGARRSQSAPMVGADVELRTEGRSVGSDPPSSDGMRISFVPPSTTTRPDAYAPTGPDSLRTPPPTSERSPVSGLMGPASSRPSSTPGSAPPSSIRPAHGGLPGSQPPGSQRPISANPQSIRDFNSAMDALKRGDRVKAERLASRAADAEPDVTDFAALLAWVRASSAEPAAVAESIVALTALLRVNPHCELALLYRAKLHRRASQPGPALIDLEQLLTLNPGHREAQSEAKLLRSRQRKA